MTNSISKPCRLLLPVAIIVALLAFAPVVAEASTTLDLSIQSMSVFSPSTLDALEVDLTNDTSGDITVNAFSFELSANSGVIFTDATTATVNNTYIFAGNSFFGPDIVTSAGPGILDAEDLWGGGGGFVLGVGQTVGLGEVFFNVAPGLAPGPYPVVFDSGPTSLSDPSGNPIAIGNEFPGTLTVSTNPAVPEPSTMALFGTALALLALARKPLAGQRTRRRNA
jgi:hypothetical protein